MNDYVQYAIYNPENDGFFSINNSMYLCWYSSVEEAYSFDNSELITFSSQGPLVDCADDQLIAFIQGYLYEGIYNELSRSSWVTLHLKIQEGCTEPPMIIQEADDILSIDFTDTYPVLVGTPV